jgi:hypothetical protein
MNKTFLNYLNFLKSKIIVIFSGFLLFFFLGIFHVLDQSPQYYVNIALKEKQTDQQSVKSSSIVSLALGVGDTSVSKFYFDLHQAIFSLEVTNKYIENFDGLKNFYKAYFNNEDQSYNPVWNLNTRIQALKFYLMGVDFSPTPNKYMLNSLIRGTISLRYDEFAEILYVESYTESPEEIKALILALLNEADEMFKRNNKDQLNEKIDFISTEIVSTSSKAQKDALVSILQNQLLNKALMESTQFYRLDVVRGLEVSEYPVKPNILFLVSLFSAFGLLMMISFFSFKFFVKESKLING